MIILSISNTNSNTESVLKLGVGLTVAVSELLISNNTNYY